MKREAKETLGMVVILMLLVFSVYCSSGYFGGESDRSSVEVVEVEDIKREKEEYFIQEIQSRDGIFAKYADRAKEILAKMTLDKKIGQMFLVRCPEENQLSLIKDYSPGGFVLFERDFENKSWQRVVGDIKSYQYTTEIPMFIAVDEEGGDVVRVSKFKEFRGFPFLSPREVFLSDGFKGIELDAAEKSQLLKRLGINLNFAPVCDVVTEEDAFMYNRSFGMDAMSTATYVKTVVNTMANNGMGSVLKHFPGYGNNKDTHVMAVQDKRDRDALEKDDFVPFKAGINEGVAGVMVSHIIFENIDKDYPASLSIEVHKLLRSSLGYQGVIIADSLDMEGVCNTKSGADVAVRAVKAGNDMLIVTDYEEQIKAVKKAVQNDEIPISLIDASVARILSWKLMLGMIN